MNFCEPIRSKEKVKEIRRYLKKNESPRNYLFFVLGINFALRISDLLSLKVKDVRKPNNDLREVIYIRERKTNKQKCIQVNEASEWALDYYFSEADVKQNDWLFPGRGNKPMDRTWCWELINKWVGKVGIEGKFGTHSFRKTWGFMARKQGVPIELIQAKFNHSNPDITRRYIGITGDEVAKIEKMVNI